MSAEVLMIKLIFLREFTVHILIISQKYYYTEKPN